MVEASKLQWYPNQENSPVRISILAKLYLNRVLYWVLHQLEYAGVCCEVLEIEDQPNNRC